MQSDESSEKYFHLKSTCINDVTSGVHDSHTDKDHWPGARCFRLKIAAREKREALAQRVEFHTLFLLDAVHFDLMFHWSVYD